MNEEKPLGGSTKNEGKVYLITGGGGSLGRALTEHLQSRHIVRVVDINEAALAEFRHKNVRRLYRDITNLEGMTFAMRGVDTCIHAAALKNLEITEYNVEELIHININGTLNVVKAAIANNVKKCIFISTDKAVDPISIYGVSKLIGEHIFLWANRIVRECNFSVVRPGNYWRSRGNVFEVWERQKSAGEKITLTHEDMVRYFIDLRKLASLIEEVERIMEGGEIFIPKVKEHRMLDLALKYAGSRDNIVFTGVRRGEKIKERLWTEEEEKRLETKGNLWVIKPAKTE